MNALRVLTRWMLRVDMPHVAAIEHACFTNGWTEDDFARCLRQRNCIGMVAEANGTIVGYMLYTLEKKRLVVMNFAVNPQFRHREVGMQMVAKLVSKLYPHRRDRITLEVRETNLPAQQFFRAMHFRARRVLRAYYDDTGEDAYAMEYVLRPENEPVATTGRLSVEELPQYP